MSIFPTLNIDKKVLTDLFSPDNLVVYEMALQSYLHKNPFVEWIVAWRMQIALRFLGSLEQKIILDYGCGLGILFLQMQDSLNRLYGTDIDIYPAEKVLAGHQRSDVILFPVQELDQKIDDDFLDVIISLEVLEHVDDLQATVLLLESKLNQNGKLIVSGPTENRFYGMLRKIAGFSGEYHKRDIYQIVDQICAIGFNISRKRTIPLPKPLDVFVIYEFVKTDQSI